MAVLEITTFTLVGDEAAFLTADKRMQTEFAYQQAGCQRRTTARGDDGEWAVVTLWGTRSDADAGTRAADGNPVAGEFWSYADPASVRTRRYDLLT